LIIYLKFYLLLLQRSLSHGALSFCPAIYMYSNTSCVCVCTHLVPRCMTMHCQTPPFDCSVIDSGEFQNHNAICCTYSHFYRSWQWLVIFTSETIVERRNRMNVADENRKKRKKKREKEQKRESKIANGCECVNSLHRMAIMTLIYDI